MELTKQNFRTMIYYDFSQGVSAGECIQKLNSTFGKAAPKKSSVYNWYNHFSRGKMSFEDEPRQGRPNTAVTSENIEAVRQLVSEDPRITCKDLKSILEIGSASLDTILHKHLRLRKRCARWVPHSLTEEQKQVRVDWCRDMITRFNNGVSKNVWEIVTGDETWVYRYDPLTKQQSAVWLFPGEDPPVKFKRARSVGKKMVAVFFAKSGHVATIPLEEQHTVTADWYTQRCLPTVFRAWQQRRPATGTRGLLIHHDNASAHTAGRTKDFLATEGVQTLSHPPYSPDLAPCDFFLFPEVKKQLRGQRFESQEDAVREFVRAVNDVTKETYSDVFRKWFNRMDKCIQAKGGYFEKLG